MSETVQVSKLQSTNRRPSRATVAYEALLEEILTLRLAPGHPIVESELMEIIGVGRTPLREALTQLEAENLVRIYPRRGTFVTDVNLRDLPLITDLRVGLEGIAAHSASVRATDADRDSLTSLLEHNSQLAQETDILAADAAIHYSIYTASHNRYLEASASQYLNLSMRMWRYCMGTSTANTAELFDHEEVVDAIVSGKPGLAQELAEAHVRSFASAISGGLGISVLESEQ